MNKFESIVSKTFSFEGGFQNDPEDSANWYNGELIGTNRGISAQAYGTFLKRKPTVQEINDITVERAKEVYKKLFWDKLLLDHVNSYGLTWIMFQYYIGDGNVMHLRRAIDGYLKSISGPSISKGNQPFTMKLIELINGLDSEKLFNHLKQYRFSRFDTIVAKYPKKKKYLNGWRNRLNKIIYS